MKILFLIAISAVLCSCGTTDSGVDELLQSFVVNNQNEQEKSLIELERGDDYYTRIKRELIATSKNAPMKGKYENSKSMLKIADKLDKNAAQMIWHLDKLKLELLNYCGEDTKSVQDKDQDILIWKRYDPSDGLRPMSLNLKALEDKNRSGSVSDLLIGSNPKSPKKKGTNLFNKISDHRLKLCEILGSYSDRGWTFSFTPLNINDYSDQVDLRNQVVKMMRRNSVNHEDTDVLSEIYMSLSKRLIDKDNDDLHWSVTTFDNTSIVATIAELSSIQTEVLRARADAIEHLYSKLQSARYAYNKMIPVAAGPASVRFGDEINLSVMCVHYDPDNQPYVTIIDEDGAQIDVANGIGNIKLKANKRGEMIIRGSVSTRMRTGAIKMEMWEHAVKVN